MDKPAEAVYSLYTAHALEPVLGQALGPAHPCRPEKRAHGSVRPPFMSAIEFSDPSRSCSRLPVMARDVAGLGSRPGASS